MPLQAEAVEQRFLRHDPLAHHRPASARSAKTESGRHHIRKAEFFNTIGAKQTVRTGSHLRRAVRVTGARNSCMILKRTAKFRKMEVRGTLTVCAIAIMGVLELAGGAAAERIERTALLRREHSRCSDRFT